MSSDDFQVWQPILLSLQVRKKDTNGTNGTLDQLVVCFFSGIQGDWFSLGFTFASRTYHKIHGGEDLGRTC